MEENKYTERTIYHTYPESLKLTVVKEYESTNCSRAYLKRKYGINSTNVIKSWVRKYGSNDYLSPQKEIIYSTMATTEDTPEIQKLKQRIKLLERELEDAKLLSEAYSLMIKKAEEELKIPIRKKYSTK